MALRSLPRERRGRAICDDTGRDRSRRLNFDPNALQSELGQGAAEKLPCRLNDAVGRAATVSRTGGMGG